MVADVQWEEFKMLVKKLMDNGEWYFCEDTDFIIVDGSINRPTFEKVMKQIQRNAKRRAKNDYRS